MEITGNGTVKQNKVWIGVEMLDYKIHSRLESGVGLVKLCNFPYYILKLLNYYSVEMYLLFS